MKTRIYFLDNLRTIMILLVVILHAGMTYMAGFESFWLVNDPDKINALGLVNMYLDIFVMFTIFFISGYLIPYSLKAKSAKVFIASKFKRILFPWILAVVTLIPAYKAIFLYSHGLPQQEWYSYFHFYSRSGEDPSFYANNPTQNWLWFLPVLFAFQMIYLALSKLNLLRWNISMKTGILLTFTLGLAYSMIISSLGLTGWFHSWVFDFQRERLLVYFMIFLLGTLASKNKAFVSENKNKRMYIISNVVLTLALGVFTAVALNLFFNIIDPERNYYFISPVADKAAYYATLLISMMSFLYVILYAFRFSFNKTNGWMKQLNNNSYQVYIIHMIVMGVFAIVLAGSGFPAIVKYLLLVLFTYSVSNLLVIIYHLLFNKRMVLKLAAVGVFAGALFTFIQTNGQVPEEPTESNEPIEQNTEAPQMGLHAAIITGNMKVVHQHILAGSDLNVKEPSGGSSPLITAATFDRTAAAKALIEAGADINFQNNDGSTALHTAAFFCRKDIVILLLSSGADKTLLNKSGSTALDAVSGPFEEVQGVYDYFVKVLGPLGLSLDYEEIKSERPEIAKLLSSESK